MSTLLALRGYIELNWSSRFQSITQSDKLAQCCGAGLCWTTASDLLHSPSGKNQPALPHSGIGCGRVHVTGALKGIAIATGNADQVNQVGFIIPLGTKPDQCHDSITPNSMYSDTSCALSAVFLLMGGFGAIMWGKGVSCSLPQISNAFQGFFDHYHCIYRYAGTLCQDRSSTGVLYWQASEYQLSSSQLLPRSQAYLIVLEARVYSTMKTLFRITGDLYLPSRPCRLSYSL